SMTQKSSFPRKLGSFLAKVQAVVDDVIEFGFKKLKSVNKKPTPPPPPDAKIKDKVIHAAHVGAGFIGEAGESYYETYQKIKAKKDKKKGIIHF
ncbi:hypothetical protein KBD59_05135, partial [Candidatus Gracilibacteria bacterium]|nr:hypothetical protein [Candidatus Gracilibacteria bacterium]